MCNDTLIAKISALSHKLLMYIQNVMKRRGYMLNNEQIDEFLVLGTKRPLI